MRAPREISNASESPLSSENATLPALPAMGDTGHQLRAQLSLRDELLAALSLMRVHEDLDFLLGTDAQMDATIVTACAAQSRSVAVKVRTETEADGATALDENFSFKMFSDWVILPAVERDAYSLGVHISKDDRASRHGQFLPDTDFRRYLCDYARDEWVSVAQCGDFAELAYLPVVGETLRRRAARIFRFDINSFQAITNSAMAANTVPDVESLLECLNLFFSYDEVRHCPLCDAPPAAFCECSQPLTAERLPVQSRIIGLRGQYEGTGEVELLAGGVSFHAVKLRQVTIYEVPEQQVLCQQLISWAARDKLGLLSPTLTRLVMPASEELQPEPTGTFAVGDHDESLPPSGLESIAGIDSSTNQLPPTSAPQCGPRRPRRGRPPSAVSRKRAAKARTCVDEVPDIASPPVPDSMHSGPFSRPMHAGSRVQQNGVPGPAAAEVSGGVSDIDGQQRKFNTEVITETMERGLQVIKAHGGSRNISREQLLRLVPMSQRDLSRTFRRAQNRESAALGNIRRRIMLQELRGNLDSARRKKIECDERLHALLGENQTLRAALAAEGRMPALHVGRRHNGGVEETTSCET